MNEKTTSMAQSSHEPLTSHSDLTSSTDTSSSSRTFTRSSQPSLASPAATMTPDAPRATNNQRLSLTLGERLKAAAAIMGVAGLLLGFTYGSKTSSLRFLAENSHRLPTTRKGWYLYHKSKNYVMLKNGSKEAFKFSAKLGFWAALFFGAEDMIDRGRLRVADALFGSPTLQPKREQAYMTGEWQRLGGENEDDELRGRTDALSTTAAGLFVGGAFAFVRRLPVLMAGQMCRMGLKAGLSYGILQDVIAGLQGQRISCVNAFRRLFSRRSEPPAGHSSDAGQK